MPNDLPDYFVDQLFFPYVDGALRAPRGSAEASGAFIGIKSGHGREHMARAVIEGIAMHYPLTLAQMSEFGTFEPPITLVDGEAVNGLWNQLKCDITGVSIRVPEIVETAAVGAAMLAGIACREYSGAAEAVNRVVRWASRYDPDPEAMHAYAPIRERYELVYDGLLAAFRAQCQQAPALEVAR